MPIGRIHFAPQLRSGQTVTKCTSGTKACTLQTRRVPQPGQESNLCPGSYQEDRFYCGGLVVLGRGVVDRGVLGVLGRGAAGAAADGCAGTPDLTL